jgi:hypothetical protein
MQMKRYACNTIVICRIMMISNCKACIFKRHILDLNVMADLATDHIMSAAAAGT